MQRIPGLRRIVRIADAVTGGRPSDVDDEITFHIACRAAELTALGLSEAEALAAARRDFGDVERYRRQVLAVDHRFTRELKVRDFLQSLGADLRYAARALRAELGFAFTAVTTLALGIAAATSVFSVVSGALLRPLPYADASRVVHVGEQGVAERGFGGTTSYDNYHDWARMSRSFSALGIVATWGPTLTGRGDPRRVPVALVSSELFDVFHVRPALGRAILPADNLPGASSVALLSFALWHDQFGSDSSVVGKSVLLNLAPTLIVGVLPPGLVGQGRMARPIWSNFVNDTSDGRSGRSKDVYGLLRPGASLSAAQAELTQISARLAETNPIDDKGETAIVDRLADRVVRDVARPLYLLLGAACVVLLIACANLSNLLLARGMTRGRELAVRSALGASRARVARQLLTESLLLALLGSGIGLALAASVATSLVKLGPAVLAQRPPSLDARVLAVAVACSVLTTLLVGLVPALRLAPHNPQTALREGGARATAGRAGATRVWLASTQLALAMLLLSASALVVKSFVRILNVDPGIRPAHLLTVQLTLPGARYDSLKSTLFYDELALRLEAVPGVHGVATTSLIPFGGDFDRVGISKISGQPDRVGADVAKADRYVVSPSYFSTMGVHLVRGRLFGRGDRPDAPSVCVIDTVFARRIFGPRDPLGERMQIPGGQRGREEYTTIVGLVAHVKTYGLDVPSPGQVYMSTEQYPWRWSSLVVRTAGDPLAFAPTVARVVHQLDADQPVADVASMDELMSDLMRGRRFTLALLGAFATVAILLAAVGLYGVIAYGVSQRRRELGVRVALGAQRSQVARMVLGEASRIALAGIAIGAIAALAAGRVLSSLLFEVSPRDGAVLASVALLLLGVAVAACLVPARRATQVDVVEVLRGA
jgi:putative ABC transport system permease protein